MKKIYHDELFDRLIAFISDYEEQVRGKPRSSVDCSFILRRILYRANEIKATPFKKPYSLTPDKVDDKV